MLSVTCNRSVIPSRYIWLSSPNILSVMVQPIKVKTKIYHTVKTIPKPNREIVEKGKIDTLNTHTKCTCIYDRSLSCLATCISIKDGEVWWGIVERNLPTPTTDGGDEHKVLKIITFSLCKKCMSFCPFLFCPLYCLSFFDLQHLTTPLVSSNFS